jgi:hypothetical protein
MKYLFIFDYNVLPVFAGLWGGRFKTRLLNTNEKVFA